MGRLIGDWATQGMYSITSYKLWGAGDEYQAIMDKYAPQMKKMHHHQTQSGYVGVKIAADAAKAAGPNLTRDWIMRALRIRRWDFGPGLGQSVLWAPGNHDTHAVRIHDEVQQLGHRELQGVRPRTSQERTSATSRARSAVRGTESELSAAPCPHRQASTE